MDMVTAAVAKKNLIKAIRFEQPDYIPMAFHINASCFDAYDPQALYELMQEHKLLFPNFTPPKTERREYEPNARKDEPFTDDFGCVWKTSTNGIVGSVHEHPLADWAGFTGYQFPNPQTHMGLGPIDWAEFEAACAKRRAAGEMVTAGLRHGHTFLQLCDIRGYENLLFDMMDEEPLLGELIQKLGDFNLGLIRHFVKAGVDMICIPEDLGMQVGPMLSADNFRQYIKPSYQRLIAPAREAGILVHMHSDGDIRLLVDDIIEGGVDAINMQDLVNGIDWIAGKFRGKTCVDLDIDRQSITPYGTPAQIDALIREEVEKIGCKEGGLTMIYGLYPGVPLENVKALMDAMERYAFYYNS